MDILYNYVRRQQIQHAISIQTHCQNDIDITENTTYITFEQVVLHYDIILTYF